MNDFNDALHRIGQAWRWIAAQFWATLLIILAGIAWTRLPDKHAWQVVLSLVIPLLLLAAVLLLEAGTMRRLLNQEPARTRFVVGSLTLLAWIAVVWLAWAILDWCNDQIPLWAGYLNSQAPAPTRARLFSYQHIQLWLTILVWIFRWIAVPGKVIPHAIASAQWGWRLPWCKLLRVLLDWRWWAAVGFAALMSVALTGHLFSFEPHGTVAHQVWAVILKLAASYLLAIASWVLLLAWAAVLIAPQPEPAECALDQSVILRLHMGRVWIVAAAVWMVLSSIAWWALPQLLNGQGSQDWVILPVGLSIGVVALVLSVGTLRAMLADEAKRVGFVWGVFSVLAWGLLALAAAILLNAIRSPAWLDALCWVVGPAVLIPIAAASAVSGLRLPWKRILQVHRSWFWWIAVTASVVVGIAIPKLLLYTNPNFSGSVQNELLLLRRTVVGILRFICWVFLTGLVTALLARDRASTAPEPRDDAGGKA